MKIRIILQPQSATADTKGFSGIKPKINADMVYRKSNGYKKAALR